MPRLHRRVRRACAILAVAGLLGSGAAHAGPPGGFQVSPTTLSFPNTHVGATSEIAVTVTNVSGETKSPNFAGGAPLDPDNFGGSQNCAGRTFDPGDSCTFTYRFTPQSEGAKSSSTSISIDGQSFSITMSGTGVFPFSVAPTTLAFPDTAVGDTSQLEVAVTNVSPVAQTYSGAGGAPPSPHFTGFQNCQGRTFAPGEGCALTYVFQPQSSGLWTDSTTNTINGKNFAISMSGTGIDPATTTTTAAPAPTDPAATAPGSPTTAEPPDTEPLGTDPVATGVDPPAPVPGPIVFGRAQVIAQGIVAFPAGSFLWDHQHLEPDVWPYVLDSSPAAFFVADGPDAILVTDDGGPLALLDAGEAALVRAGASGAVTPLFDGAEAAGRRITFVGGTGPGAFVPGEARRDVNLIRGVLHPDESVGVGSPFAMLVVVTAGGVVDATGTVIDVETGPVTLQPNITLHNEGPEPATVLVATVGGTVG